MKHLIKKLLNESLNEIVSGGEYIVYHGTNSDIQKFSDEFVGKEEATDQEGPGIYFTTLKEESEMYGKNLYSVKLTPRKLMDMTPINKNKWRSFTTKMLQSAPDWEDTAQNFNQNPRKGLILAVESMMDYNETEKDLAQQIWYDFYRYNPVDFVRNIVKMGIDGIIVPREKSEHIIVYNPNIIHVLNKN
jgi:hypothetical protein